MDSATVRGESFETRDVSRKRKDITVKFHLTKAQVVAHAYPSHHTVDEVREHIANKFQVQSRYLVLKQGTTEVSPGRRLDEICHSEYGVVDLDLLLTDDGRKENVQLNLKLYYRNLALPDIITVRIPTEDGRGSRDLVVEIENQVTSKPFFGGYVNKRTNIEYHHAFTQTGPPREKLRFDGIISRDTQTASEKVTATALPSSKSVQHSSVALQSKPADGCIEPGEYESYEQLEGRLNMVGKATVIQRNYRSYRCRKLIKESAAKWRALQVQQANNERDDAQQQATDVNRRCTTKQFPKSKQQFDALFAQVHSWKENELKLIGEKYSGAPKIAEMNILLDKEIQLLNGIERQRHLMRSEQSAVAMEKQLKKLSEPIRWVGYNNTLIEMETIKTQRARFYLSFYSRLKDLPVTDKHERIMLLNEVCDIIMREQHPLAGELERLLQRERDLLLCKLNEDDFRVLHKRQLTILAEIIKADPDILKEKTKTKLCKKCKRLRPTDRFTLNARQKSADVCEQCAALCGTTVDTAVYRSILRAIRRDERKRGSLSSYAFIIQESEVKHIVENIWHGHSVISNEAIRSQLRLPRWNVGQDWSPWNCICLTERETRAHMKVQRLHEFYQPAMLKEVQNKHALARSVFGQLREIDQEFTESGDWWQVGLDGKTV